MFTTGSKLFLGATVLALAGTLFYGFSQDGGPLGTLSLATATLVLGFLAGINFWVRDGNVSSMDTEGIAASPAAHDTAGRSLWPMVAGLGVALVPVGLVTGYAVVWIALGLLLVAMVEWMVQAWSERASGDAEYNRSIRRRLLHPLELPVLGALGLGLIIFSFSRIMLRLPSAAGAVAFGGIAAGVLLFGSLIAAKRTVARSLVVALCTIGGVGVVGAGVASAVAGGRHIEPHEIPSFEEGTCSAETDHESDEDASRAIADKSNLAATIILENGVLRAEVEGVAGNPDHVTIPRTTYSFIRFRNLDEGKHRLVVNLGKDIVDPQAATPTYREIKDCTQAVGENGTQFLNIYAVLPSPTDPEAPADEQFSFTVPGVDTAVLRIVVP